MSFGVAAAMGLTGVGAAMMTGAIYGGLTTVGMNLIRGNDPFDNIGQGLLMGGVGGGIFGAAGAAAGEGAAATTGATLDAASNVIPAQNLAVTSGNASADLLNRFGDTPIHLSQPFTETFGFKPSTEYNYFNPDSATAQAYYNNVPPSLPPEIPADPSFGSTPVGTTDMRLNTQNPLGGYTDQFGRSLDATGAPISNGAVAPKTSTTSPTTTSPKFREDPFGYLTHKDNRGTAMLGGLGIAGAMGAFKPNTLNTTPKTASFYEITYNAPQFVTDPVTGRVTYVAGSQGYGPGNRVTRNVAAGGGIRALSSGGNPETAPFVSMPSRGQKPANQKSPRSAEDSPAFKDYEDDDEFAKERADQKRIDNALASWVKRLGEADIAGTKNMAEGGPSNLPAAYQQPQYQISDFANSPLFQPTGGNAPVQPGISEYIANLNQRSYAPPATVAAPAVTDTTSPTIYDPVTQRYSTNPNLAVPSAVENGSTDDSNPSDGGFSNNQEKAGGPIKGKKYAMGGLAALPEYAAGGKLLSGDGDGMSDSIPAVIKGARPQRAALADGEFVIPADVVSHLGNGSTKAGGKRLYEMMANIRKARTGNSKQGKQINPMKFIPA